MSNQFDELTRSVAQPATRRGALKQFAVGLAATALASFGLANKAEAKTRRERCWQRCMNTCVPDFLAQGWPEENANFQCSGICSFKCGL